MCGRKLHRKHVFVHVPVRVLVPGGLRHGVCGSAGCRCDAYLCGDYAKSDSLTDVSCSDKCPDNEPIGSALIAGADNCTYCVTNRVTDIHVTDDLANRCPDCFTDVAGAHFITNSKPYHGTHISVTDVVTKLIAELSTVVIVSDRKSNRSADIHGTDVVANHFPDEACLQRR